MLAIKLIVRVGLSLVAGWYLLVLPMWTAGFIGYSPWGFFHSGWVLFSLPITIFLAFWLLGFVPYLRLRTRGAISKSS